MKYFNFLELLLKDNEGTPKLSIQVEVCKDKVVNVHNTFINCGRGLMICENPEISLAQQIYNEWKLSHEYIEAYTEENDIVSEYPIDYNE